MRKKLIITFLSEWRIASGLGDGMLADAMLVRDRDGIPFLPGRALKGALREGARRLGLCRSDLRGCEDYFWGSRSDVVASNTPGQLSVSPGTLAEDILHILRNASEQDRDLFVRDMTMVRSQTSLDEKGRAKTGSLRSFECGVPGMEFSAELDITAAIEKNWLDLYFRAVCAATKNIGGYRSRGLGLCSVRISDDTDVRVSLPPVNGDLCLGGDLQ